MAVAAYYSWDNLGRPLEPARPIRELVEKLRVAYPRAAKLFSWYADNAHYQSNYPQDHTPFSVTGWPLTSPQWMVFATDVMHRPDLGVDCDKLFAYWLAEAKAGRMPWLKYLIYKATVYDVRYGWRPQPSSGHDKHIHLSARTDHANTSLGGWSVTGTGGSDPMIGLSLGDSGDEVRYAQELLHHAGFPPGDLDGKYGPATSKAVLACRKSLGSGATSGDHIDGVAASQIMRALVRNQAGEPGPAGPRGPAGPQGPAGRAGRDGLGAGSKVTITGTIAQA